MTPTALPLPNISGAVAALGDILHSTSSTLWKRASQPISSTLKRAATTVSDLTCPAADGTVYTEANKNSYSIHCSSDNNYTSFSTVSIDGGGFTTCFGACDNVTSCGGFTFVGLDGGSCYLKRSMPNDTFVAKEGDNYISVVRINKVDVPLSNSTASSSTTSSANTTSTSASPTKGSDTPVGAIAGGVVGGVAGLSLVLLVISILVRRRRKKVDESRAATKSHSFFGPREDSMKREDSSKGEVFAPYGGFYRGTVASHGTDNNVGTSPVSDLDSKAGLSPTKSLTETMNNPNPAQLDGTPVYSNSIRGPPADMVEMADTSIPAFRNKHLPNKRASIASESPVLGRKTVGSDRNVNDHAGRQHMMSWNNYDDREAMSPPSTMSSGISPMVISPPDTSPDTQSSAWYRAAQRRGHF